jgi:hypothetical protein
MAIGNISSLSGGSIIGASSGCNAPSVKKS